MVCSLIFCCNPPPTPHPHTHSYTHALRLNSSAFNVREKDDVINGKSKDGGTFIEKTKCPYLPYVQLPYQAYTY